LIVKIIVFRKGHSLVPVIKNLKENLIKEIK
jgi:hypothetical protein